MNKSNTFVVLFTVIVGGTLLWLLFGPRFEATEKSQPALDSAETKMPGDDAAEKPQKPSSPASSSPRVVKRPVIDGSRLVMEINNWRTRGTSTQMIPWEGQRLVFMTMENQSLDAAVLKNYVARLSDGWSIYDDLIPGTPPLRKQFNNKPTMIATPGVYACGLGCGYIGSTGIEVSSFYQEDYQRFVADPNSFRHYYFYEMGRNWFVFGDQRYGMFKSSFAVHMRYVCMQRLKLNYAPGDLTYADMLMIEKKYRESADVDYFKHFTENNGFALKQILKDQNSDRNTVYTGIMLKLENEFGKHFLPRYYQAVLLCPGKFDYRIHEGAKGQTLNWIAACSFAAEKDLSGLFANDYHVPLSQAHRKRFASVVWKGNDAIKQLRQEMERDD